MAKYQRHKIKYCPICGYIDLTEKENSITIRKKYGDTVKFTVTEKESKNIIKIIYGIPLLIILIGYIVWRIRRNKK